MNKKELQERKHSAEEELTAIAERYAEEALAANVKSLEAAVSSTRKKPKYETSNYAVAQRDMDERRPTQEQIVMEQARQVVMPNAVPEVERFRWTIPQPREDVGAQVRAVQQRLDAEDRMRHAERMLTEVIGGAF